ncbi:MAG: trigger factor [Clostridia bacterium]|nr:trigger factor [Clostridia bacterium]
MVQAEKLEGGKVRLTIEISKELFLKALNEAYHKTASRYNIPGFRRGKAPRKVIENMYGAGCFYEDAFELCWGDAYDSALAENGFVAVDKPQLDILSISEEEGVTFTAEVQLKPEVTLGQYKGIVIPKQEYNVSDDEVSAELEKEKEKQARYIDVEREVRDGDRIVLDYSGSVDGVKFDGGTAEGQTLVIGSHTFIPGFEEQLIGAAIGEEKDIVVTFPEQYQAENLAGKEAVFACTVKTISEKELPEIDDEFIKDISEFDTIDEWKADKKAKMTEERAQRNKTVRENNALKGACDNATVDIPDCMIDRQIEYMLRDLSQRLMSSGISLEDYCGYLGTSVEELRNNYREEAEARVKMQLVIEAVTKAENIEATDEEIDESIADYAKQNSMEVEDFAKNLTSDDRDYLADRIAVQKTLALIIDSAVEQ